MKNNNNIGKVLLGVGVGGLVLLGIASMGGEDSSSSGGSSSGGSGGSGSGGSGGGSGPGGQATLEQLAAQLRADYLVVSDCAIEWRNASSRSGLLSHVTDFFAPAINRARSMGASSVDQITSSIAQLIVPGCPQPPSPLSTINLDDALAGRLNVAQQQAFNYAQVSYPAVQFYLAVRSVVTTVLAAVPMG